MELQLTEIFMLGTGLITITGSYFGVKFGLNGTKKAIKNIQTDVAEIKEDNRKFQESINQHTTDIAVIKQHCADVQNSRRRR